MIYFDEATHTYTNEAGKVLISVTQLLRKHGLAPDYSAVQSDVLERASERGTLIHKEIEDYITNGEIGFTEELASFIDYIGQRGDPIFSEHLVANDLIAGTIDLIYRIRIDYDTLVIADYKTTSTLHVDSVTWQLSLYAYLFDKEQYSAFKAEAFHFQKDGSLKVIPLNLKPIEAVEQLIACERNGEIYSEQLPVEERQLRMLADAEEVIQYFESQKKEAEAKAQQIREAILLAMEKNSVKKFENDRICVTYVAPSQRVSIDSATLKKEMPEIAEKYSKTSQVKAQIRIKLKGVEEG